jgi:hypothetical protein
MWDMSWKNVYIMQWIWTGSLEGSTAICGALTLFFFFFFFFFLFFSSLAAPTLSTTRTALRTNPPAA